MFASAQVCFYSRACIVSCVVVLCLCTGFAHTAVATVH
jgi:hypothetical protein